MGVGFWGAEGSCKPAYLLSDLWMVGSSVTLERGRHFEGRGGLLSDQGTALKIQSRLDLYRWCSMTWWVCGARCVAPKARGVNRKRYSEHDSLVWWKSSLSLHPSSFVRLTWCCWDWRSGTTWIVTIFKLMIDAQFQMLLPKGQGYLSVESLAHATWLESCSGIRDRIF